jgi:chorismate synthase
MNKPTSRRSARRTAWWVAFAALAGFLLADLT